MTLPIETYQMHLQNTIQSGLLCLVLQSDAHYSALSLLLFLSDSPLNTDFTERPRLKEAGEMLSTQYSFKNTCIKIYKYTSYGHPC